MTFTEAVRQVEAVQHQVPTSQSVDYGSWGPGGAFVSFTVDDRGEDDVWSVVSDSERISVYRLPHALRNEVKHPEYWVGDATDVDGAVQHITDHPRY